MSDGSANLLEPTREAGTRRPQFTVPVRGFPGYLRRNPRAVAGLILALLAIGMPIIHGMRGNALIGLAFACLACAVALAPSRSSTRGSMAALLPFAFLCLLAEGIAITLALGLFQQRSLLGEWGSWLVWLLIVGPWAAVAIYRGGRFRVVAGDRASAVVLSAMIVFGAAVAVWIPLEEWSRLQSIHTDLTRHIVMMKGVLDAGSLQYSSANPFTAYPRGLSAFVGVLWRASGQSTFTQAFFTFSGVLWLMVSLILAALVTAGSGLARATAVKPWLGQGVLPILVILAYANGVWVTGMWPYGFATTLVGGLCLAVVCLMSLPGQANGRLGLLLGATAIVLVTVHTWSLVTIPVVCVALLWLVLWLKESSPKWTAIFWTGLALAVVAVACLPPVLTRSGTASALDLVKTPGASGLTWPGVWWGLAMAAAVGMSGVAWRHGLHRWTLTWLLLVVSIAGSVAAIWLLSDSTVQAPSYYVLKLMWTGSVIVLPVALAGVVWAVDGLVRRAGAAPNPALRIGVLTVLVGALTVVAAFAAGQVAGGGLRVLTLWSPRALPSYQNVVNTQLEGSDIVASRPQGILVWGMSPVFKYPQFPDYTNDRELDHLTLEGLSWFWPDRLYEAEIQPTERSACRYLEENPDALRITGSAPESGPAWLIASGCPESVVKPNEWHRISVPPEWSKGVWSEESPPQHMTFEEFRKEGQAMIDARKGSSS